MPIEPKVQAFVDQKLARIRNLFAQAPQEVLHAVNDLSTVMMLDPRDEVRSTGLVAQYGLALLLQYRSELEDQ